ncbi:CUB domain-containing protein 1a [Salarias fasciatus]|uniref:CUB domain-containing protein 1a n=1 Tax=Salarias fasciatus TaxID=181472 RepID=UPI00117662E8|nr:CUB domain-containing protein 1-like [Salarias fasciatus]
MSSPAGRISLQGFLLVLIVSTVSGGPKFTVSPGHGTVLTFSNSQGKGCQVCTGSGRSRRCSVSLSLKDNTLVEFDCTRPQDVFTVEVVQNIECTAKTCSGHIVPTDSGSLPFLDFTRRFIWNLKASAPKALRMDFTDGGLRQIAPSERCPDGHMYTLQVIQTTGTVAVGKYCRLGSITSAQILNQGRLTLEIPARQMLQSSQFDVSVGEEIKSLARVSLMLPKGTSSSELLSPNYPDTFPDDDVMEWYFQVPPKHKTAVQFLNLTQPQCLKKEAAVEYHSKGRGALVLGLTDAQPAQTEGDFSLTLRNCEMDRTRSGSPGLSLNIRVSAKSTSSTVMCKVDAGRLGDLSLHIHRVRPASDCVMKINSAAKDKITVTSNSALTFQDCLPDDVNVTATRVIGCSDLKDCPKAPVALLVPLLPSCLPAPLSSVTWTLRPPQQGTVQLSSPAGPLKQSLPGQVCNDSILFKVDEEGGGTVGHFCPRGAIQKIQVHTNVSVTWLSNMGARIQRSYFKYVLNASFEKEITERYIFTVSPMKDSPVLLASPGWPVGMEPYSTVSWIVSVPPKMEAILMFANLSQPKCSNRHTNIRVQRFGSPEEDYSRREDEEAEMEISVPESFYLNMSNCKPERGDFSVITKITLQKARNRLLTIILSVVAALLVIFAVVLAVVCVVVRKKKKKLDHQVSVYNPNGTSFLPGPNGRPKSDDESEYHVYASIEDTLVYTHLLKKGAEIGVYGDFDTYRPFPGHSDSQKPPVSTNADGVEVDTYRPFRPPSQQGPPLPNRPPSHVQSLVDNELYHERNRTEEGNSPHLGRRMEPEGGN